MPNEDKSARYHRLRRRAALGGIGATALVLTVLVASGGAAALRDGVQAAAGESVVPAVIVYVALLVMLMEGVQLPFAYYQGVVLERRFDLGVPAMPSWWHDRIKSAGITLFLACVGGVVVILLARRVPDAWWVVGAGVVVLMTVALTSAAPVVLFPLFYRITPLDRPQLSARLVALARRADTTVMGVFEWRLSDRTRKASAALAGLGTTRRILLSDTLLAAHSDDEIEVILAHELAHDVHRDIWSGLLVDSLAIVAAFYAADRVVRLFSRASGSIGPGDLASLPLMLLASGVVVLALMPLGFALSRAHERRADRYALDLTGNPDAFVTTLRRLAAQNLAEERPSRMVRWLFHSHPSTAERIAAARRWAGPAASGARPI